MSIKLLLAALVGFAPTVEEPHEHDHTVAAMIMTAPVDASVPNIPDKAVRTSMFRWCVKNDAISLPAFCFTDYSYTENPQKSFAEDVVLIRKQRELPPLIDALSFPPYEVVKEELENHRKYRVILHKRLVWETDRADRIRNILVDLEPIIEILVAAEMATHDRVPVCTRRRGLATLKQVLTAEAYFWGWLPNGVPE